VGVTHEGRFVSVYAHLSYHFVELNKVIKRGELIGLSGSSQDPYWPHLHFGIMRPGGNWLLYFDSYNPAKFWLGGKPACFDPAMDYSAFEAREITFPIPCGEYMDMLIKEAEPRKKDSKKASCP